MHFTFQTSKKGAREDDMIGWRHWLNGREFEQTPGDSEAQGSLSGCSLMGLQKDGHNLVTEQQERSYKNTAQLNYVKLLIFNHFWHTKMAISYDST